MKNQCVRKSRKTGRRCRLPAMKGTTVCNKHGGMAPQIKRAAERNVLLADAAKYIPTIEQDPRDPIEHLLTCLRWSAHVAVMLGDKVAEEGANPTSLTWKTWEQERDRYARIAKACVDAGIAERVVAVVEEQAAMFSRALWGILRELDVAEDDRAPEVVHRHMLQLTQGGSDADSE